MSLYFAVGRRFYASTLVIAEVWGILFLGVRPSVSGSVFSYTSHSCKGNISEKPLWNLESRINWLELGLFLCEITFLAISQEFIPYNEISHKTNNIKWSSDDILYSKGERSTLLWYHIVLQKKMLNMCVMWDSNSS